MTTLNVAATAADSGLARERQKLADKELREKQLRERLDRLQQESQEVSALLGEVGRDRLAQEQRLAGIEQAFAERASDLVQWMDGLGLEPTSFEPQPPATQPDPLGIGEVPVTEQPRGYIQQVGENGGQPPTSMTQPVPAVVFDGDPNRRQELPGNVGEVADQTGGRPVPGDQSPKGRGRRG